jgi:hypothetical protein
MLRLVLGAGARRAIGVEVNVRTSVVTMAAGYCYKRPPLFKLIHGPCRVVSRTGELLVWPDIIYGERRGRQQVVMPFSEDQIASSNGRAKASDIKTCATVLNAFFGWEADWVADGKVLRK